MPSYLVCIDACEIDLGANEIIGITPHHFGWVSVYFEIF
jgi:hypothetical protein